jgi:PRC-barrel domain protein
MNDATRVTGRTVDKEETDCLISSEKVDGTAVFNRAGDHLGTIHHLMIDKYTGQVAFAVMSFGGFMGMGESWHPLPWRMLDYDPRLGGYVVDIDRSRLEGAPRYQPTSHPDWSDPDYRSRVQDYWLPPL